MKTSYWIHKNGRLGVIGDPIDARDAEHPFETLDASDFEEVSAEEYENTVLDYRYEDDEWQQ